MLWLNRCKNLAYSIASMSFNFNTPNSLYMTLASLYNATELPTIHNLQAGRFESVMCKDKDQHQNFCKKQSIRQHHENI